MIIAYADKIFREQLYETIHHGATDKGQEVRPVWKNGESAYSTYTTHDFRTIHPHQGVPIQTWRSIPWKLALKEILAIYQKHATTKQEFHNIGIRWWDSWFDKNDSLGTAYSYQLKKKIQFPEGEFTQFDRVLWLLKNKPMDRRIISNMLNLEEMVDMALPACAFMTMWSVRGEYLDLILVQRSGDFYPAAGFGGVNSIQYYFLLAMVSQATGYKIGKFSHLVNNLHIYNKHDIYLSDAMKANTHPSPTLWINPDIKDFYDFTDEDIKLIDYKYDTTIKNIPIAI